MSVGSGGAEGRGKEELSLSSVDGWVAASVVGLGSDGRSNAGLGSLWVASWQERRKLLMNTSFQALPRPLQAPT